MARKTAGHLKIKIADWTIADQVAWAAARRPGDVYEPGGLASEVSATSAIWMADAYGYWVGWLKRKGLLPDGSSALDALCRDHVISYVTEIREDIASCTAAIRVRKLYLMVRRLAP